MAKAIQKQDISQHTEKLASEIKIELRSIIRQWDKLHKPLRCSEKINAPKGSPSYRIEEAHSYEELQELVLRFAGSVWHLKDRLKLWVEAKGLVLRETASNGKKEKTSIEAIAKKSPNLLLCADLYNTKKHSELDGPRTKYTPILNGVSLDTSKSGVIGIKYDGKESKTGDIVTTNPEPVPWHIEILSGDGKYCFGDAVVVVTRGFGYWIPIIRQLGILDDEPESTWIANNLCRIEEYIGKTSPFKPGENTVNFSNKK
jgi:hypothetical protein